MNKPQDKYANVIPMPELAAREDQLLPFPIYEKLRSETPIRYDETRKAWDLFRYADCHRVLSDPAAFSSRRGMDVRQENLLVMDPPKHTQMRNLVNKAFTPRAIANLTPRIEEITNFLLDDVVANGKMDMVHDLAFPLPVIVIAELLGVPAKDREFFKEMSDTLVAGAKDSTDEAFNAIIEERKQAREKLSVYFSKILDKRRQEPQEDLISALLAAEIDGQHLTQQELLAFCMLLLAAGNETTTNLITNSIRYLSEAPHVQEQLLQHPELINSFVEESLRYYPPIVAIGRIATKDVEIGGKPIKAGEQVISWVGSANRDEAKFASPHEFQPDRSPNPHMAFGFGIHFCLGAPLARLEAQIALKAIIQRIGNMKLVPGTELTPIPSPFVFGMKAYPITFDVR